MRCEDLDVEGRYKSHNTRLLAIIPGPKEPQDLNPFLCFVGAAFERLRKEQLAVRYLESQEENIVEKNIDRYWALWIPLSGTATTG